MTLTPAQHYQRADELLAELETYDPIAATRVPTTQFKLRLAEVHARLAQSPWWPDVFDDEFEHPTGDQIDILRARIHGPHIETRSATGDRL
ncbi:hypothetical protein JVX93_15780 [Mycolicibacterium boenickei]|nr:hypothetical protein JVX93_15780 [Mycolicibacterium boenickei]